MIRDVVRVTLGAEPQARVDYVDVVDVDTLAPPDALTAREQAPASGTAPAPAPPTGEAPMLVAVAAHVGTARLIDNVVIGDPADEDRLLTATA